MIEVKKRRVPRGEKISCLWVNLFSARNQTQGVLLRAGLPMLLRIEIVVSEDRAAMVAGKEKRSTTLLYFSPDFGDLNHKRTDDRLVNITSARAR
jgi:hypothetical protein